MRHYVQEVKYLRSGWSWRTLSWQGWTLYEVTWLNVRDTIWRTNASLYASVALSLGAPSSATTLFVVFLILLFIAPSTSYTLVWSGHTTKYQRRAQQKVLIMKSKAPSCYTNQLEASQSIATLLDLMRVTVGMLRTKQRFRPPPTAAAQVAKHNLPRTFLSLSKPLKVHPCTTGLLEGLYSM